MYIHAKDKDATFTLSDPTTIAPWETLPGGPLVHLSWSPASPELAVIDAVGRVLIISFSANLNRPSPSRRWDGDSIDDLQAVVGTYWLPSHHTANPRVRPKVFSLVISAADMLLVTSIHAILRAGC